jgi:putative Mg2+ transporter-C (MgtC) family protein
MILMAIGITTYMLLGRLIENHPSSLSRTLQAFLSGIGFLAVLSFSKVDFDVKGQFPR